MTTEDYKKLRVGDVVRNTGSGQVYVITHEMHNALIASRSIEVSNPPEWEKVWPIQLGQSQVDSSDKILG